MALKSKDMYNMLTNDQKDKLPVLRIHFKTKGLTTNISVWETGGRIKIRELKKNALKVYTIKYNRKELMKHTL